MVKRVNFVSGMMILVAQPYISTSNSAAWALEHGEPLRYFKAVKKRESARRVIRTQLETRVKLKGNAPKLDLAH